MAEHEWHVHAEVPNVAHHGPGCGLPIFGPATAAAVLPLDGLEETIARAQWRAVLEDYPEAATRIDFDDMPDAWRTRVLRRASLVARALAGDGAR